MIDENKIRLRMKENKKKPKKKSKFVKDGGYGEATTEKEKIKEV